jgi:hypothetical protein
MTKYYFIVFFFIVLGCKKSEPPIPASPVTPPVNEQLKLTSSSYILGNREKNIPDSFLLQFNKKVSFNYIRLKSNLCLPDFKHEIVNSGTLVRVYNVLCWGLGAEYTFEYSVSDNSGKTLVDSIQYNCYTKKVNFTGYVQDYFVTDDNKYCWVITSQPNQLICIDIDNGTVAKKFDLNFTPVAAVYNYYNNKIYLTRASWDNVYPNSIFVLNPSSGVIEKTIPILPDQYDLPQAQNVSAYTVNFGLNGYGVVLMGASVGYGRWKIIDSRLNDSIYIHPGWLAATGGYGNSRLSSFKSAQLSHDKTRIYMLEMFGSARLGVLDCVNQDISEYEPPNASLNYNNFIIPNKLRNSIYFGNIQYQYIVSGNSILGYTSSLDNRFTPSADFSYRANEQNMIYYLNDNNGFSLMSHNTGTTLMRCKMKYGLKDITATTDGKYIVTSGESSIYIFDTNMFYRHL